MGVDAGTADGETETNGAGCAADGLQKRWEQRELRTRLRIATRQGFVLLRERRGRRVVCVVLRLAEPVDRRARIAIGTQRADMTVTDLGAAVAAEAPERRAARALLAARCAQSLRQKHVQVSTVQ